MDPTPPSDPVRDVDTGPKEARRPDRTRSVVSAAWQAGGALWLAAGLVRLRPHGASTIGAVALLAATVARLAFVGAEITSLVQGHDDNALLPVGATLTAASLTTYGVVVARRRRTGPRRFAVLAMGAYPIVAMIPVAAATGEPPALLIALWGVLMVLIGFAIRGDALSTMRSTPNRVGTPGAEARSA